MSEERLARMEDMLEQLIGLVGKVINSQQDMKAEMSGMKAEMSGMKAEMSGMKADITSINSRLERIEEQNERYQETNGYLLDKTGEHDHDIHVLKQRLLKI